MGRCGVPHMSVQKNEFCKERVLCKMLDFEACSFCDFGGISLGYCQPQPRQGTGHQTRPQELVTRQGAGHQTRSWSHDKAAGAGHQTRTWSPDKQDKELVTRPGLVTRQDRRSRSPEKELVTRQWADEDHQTRRWSPDKQKELITMPVGTPARTHQTAESNF